MLEIEATHTKAEAADMIREISQGSLRIASLEGEVKEKVLTILRDNKYRAK